MKKTIKEKIKELSAIYNTYGLNSGFAKMAEKALLNNNSRHIDRAKELSAMARHII